MQSAKKVVLIPPIPANQIGSGVGHATSNQDESTTGMITLESQLESKQEKVKSKIYDKIHRFVKVILKIARKFGYDADLKIKTDTGKYLEKSNIVDLLTHAMSPGKVLYGENEFIKLLYSAGVSPDLIINENVKSKLIYLINKGANTETLDESMEIEANRDDRTRKRSFDRTGNEHGLEVEPKKFKSSEKITLEKESMPPRESVIKYAKPSKRKAEEGEYRSDIHPRYEDVDDENIDENLWEIPKE